jgi:hypothetical protein
MGERFASGAQIAANGQAIAARQGEVKHQQIEALAQQQALHLLRIANGAHLKAVLAEIALQHGAQISLVVEHEQTRRRSIGLSVWCSEALDMRCCAEAANCKDGSHLKAERRSSFGYSR